MSSPFQRRIVGTIILVAIGVIVLPDLFDGKKQHYQEEFASIPIKPQLSTNSVHFDVKEPEIVDAELPDEPVEVQVVSTNQEKTSQSSSIEENEEVLEIVENANTTENEKIDYAKNAWIIQLGVFRNVDNGKALVHKLRSKGFQAHLLPKSPKEDDLVRVVVGPNISKESLEEQLPKLKEMTNLNGRIFKFNPLNP